MTDEQLLLKMILDESGFSAGLNSAIQKLGQFDGEVGRTSQSGGAKMGSIWTTFVGNFLASGATKIISGGMNMIKSSIDGAVSRFDTMKKFPAVMTTLGYSTDEVDSSINKLSDGIDGLPTRLDEIVANTQSLAMATGSLDKGTDSAIALNNAFLASGSSSADASRGLVQYTQMLSKGKVDMQSWNSLQDTMGLALQKTGEAFGFAGKTAKTDLYNALQEGTITFDQFNDKIIEMNDGVGGFAELAKKNSEGIATSFANIQSAVVKGVANAITALDDGMKNAGLGSIAENFDKVKGMINKAFGAFNNYLPTMIEGVVSLANGIKTIINIIKPFTPLILGVAAGFATFFVQVKVIPGIIKNFKNMVGAINGVVKTTKILFALMSANPLTIWVGVIATVVAGLIYLWKTNEGFRDFVKTAWEVIKNTIISAWEGITNAWTKTTEFFSNLWVQIKETAVNAWNSFVEAIQIILQPFIEIFMSYWNNMSSGLSQIWEGIKQYAAGAWEMIKNVILAPILLLIDLITGDFEGMKNHISQIWENIKNAASLMWTGMKNILGGIVSATVGAIKAHWQNFKNFIESLWSGIKTIASNIWTGIKDTVSNLVTGAVNGIRDAWTKAVDWTKEKFDAIKNTILAIKDINLFEIGKNIIQGLIDGIGNMIGKVKDSIVGVANTVKDNLKGMLGIHSPSRWARDMIGKNLMLGMAIGVDQNANRAVQSVSDAVDTIKDNLSLDTDYGYNSEPSLVRSSTVDQSTVTSKKQAENQKTEIHVHLTSYGLIPESNLIKQAKQLAQILKQQMDLDQAAVGGV